MMISKFEILPNEIINQCFEYFNLLDILRSFNNLNSRLNHLIHNNAIHLNCHHFRKRNFDDIRHLLLANPEMKEQIYSLHLSNKGTCGQIAAFLSHLPLNELVHLRTLAFTHLEFRNITQLKSTLPFLDNLTSFELISPQVDDDGITSVLPMSKLQRLSLPSLRSFLIHIQQPVAITYLTIQNCSLEQLTHQLFPLVPFLKYLNVESIIKYNRPTDPQTNRPNCNMVHLKELIISEFKYDFIHLARFLKRMRNLENLTLTTMNDRFMLYARYWKILITKSLPRLISFKFIFEWQYKTMNDRHRVKFSQFQSDFWTKQHHWSIQLLIDKSTAYLYTIPYPSNRFVRNRTMKILGRTFVYNTNAFNNVTDLTLTDKQIINRHFARLPNVHSLTLVNSEEDIIRPDPIGSLQAAMDLSHLKHLDMSQSRGMISSDGLVELLKQSSQLSSMTIDPIDLEVLYNNVELCSCFKRMIRKVNLYKYAHGLFNTLDDMDKFCQVFSSIEQLVCHIHKPNNVLYLLDQLSNLSMVHVYLTSLGNKADSVLFRKKAKKFNFIFRFNNMRSNAPELSIWIDKNIN